jgi:CheY-like chemotaxis protein
MFAAGSTVPLRILAADDDPSVILSLSYALKPDGHSVRGVNDGWAALREIRSQPGEYDLLITDHAMEGMDGLTLVKKLRSTDCKLPIFVLSAVLDPALTVAFKDHEVQQLIRKPFDLGEIRTAIAAAASPRRLTESAQ